MKWDHHFCSSTKIEHIGWWCSSVPDLFHASIDVMCLFSYEFPFMRLLSKLQKVEYVPRIEWRFISYAWRSGSPWEIQFIHEIMLQGSMNVILFKCIMILKVCLHEIIFYVKCAMNKRFYILWLISENLDSIREGKVESILLSEAIKSL